MALYASVIDERLHACAVWEAPVSYKSMILEQPGFPAGVYLFDVLTHYEIDDLMAGVAPRPLLILDAVDGTRKPLTVAQTTHSSHRARQVYQLSGAESALSLDSSTEGDAGAIDILAEWFEQQAGCLEM